MLTATVVKPEATRARSEPTSRRATVVSRAMLALALAPIVVAVGRAVVTEWVPTGDAAFFTVRSRDVLTRHHPWFGALSSASAVAGDTVRNLGPLQLDLLAPFTKVEPYAGTAVGVGAVAAASVISVWWASRRVLGHTGAVVAMLATLALQAAIGSQPFIDPRQQLYLLLPFWAVLWLTFAAASGDGAAIAPLVFAASLVVQTHFSYLFQTIILVIVGLVGFVIANRGRWRQARAARYLVAGSALAMVCWAQPLWDQVAGEGNLGRVLAAREISEGVGSAQGIRLVASSSLRPPRFWLPGTMEQLGSPPDRLALPAAVLTIASWLVLLAASGVVATRRGFPRCALLSSVAASALGAAVVACWRIPPSSLGLIAQNYFWMWPTAVFVTVGVVVGLLSGVPVVRRWPIAKPAVVVAAAAGAVMAAGAIGAVDHFAPTASAITAHERVARPIVDQLSVWLKIHNVEGPVVIDYSRLDPWSNFYFVLAELQQAGIEFVFEPGDANVHRFGGERCWSGQPLPSIVLADESEAQPRAGEVVLANVDAFSGDDRGELDRLDRQFGEWLREGTVNVELSGIEFFSHRELPDLRRVLATPDVPASGLARLLARSIAWDVVHVPSELDDSFARWVDLEWRSVTDAMTVLFAPAPSSTEPADERRCDM